MKNLKHNIKNRGFTLVELLIAIAFFSMISVVLTGAFLAAFRSQRAAFAFLNMQNNIRFVLEVMNREMRTGTNFSLLAADRIRFRDDRGQIVEYCFFDRAIRKEVGGGSCRASSDALTARNVNVENLRFVLSGAGVGDGMQPRITILVRIAADNLSADLQVTVTQRELDT